MIEYNLDIATVDQLSKAELIDTINHLILHDFERLIYVLYRIDVSEHKIKYLLENKAGNDAAMLIAEAILARQAEKRIAKEQYKQAPPTKEEDAW